MKKYKVTVVSVLSVGWFNFMFLCTTSRQDIFWLAFPVGLTFLLILVAILEGWPFQMKPINWPGILKSLAVGWGSAVALYTVFYLGWKFLVLIFPGSSPHVVSVYNLKEGQSHWKVGLLLAFFIGPGEELLWRGYLQRRWCELFGSYRGLAVAVLFYATAHLSSGNPVLVLAALVCGIWWGVQYLWGESLISNIVSHVFWDLMIFLWIPFRK